MKWTGLSAEIRFFGGEITNLLGKAILGGALTDATQRAGAGRPSVGRRATAQTADQL